MLKRILFGIALLAISGCGMQTDSGLRDDAPEYKIFISLSEKANPLDEEMFAIMASSKVKLSPDSLKLCFGKFEECKKDDAKLIEYDTIDEDGKIVFLSKTFYTITKDMFVTAIAKEDGGEQIHQTIQVKPFGWTPEVELEVRKPQRAHIGFVEFSKWKDMLNIDVAFLPPEDESSKICTLVDPIKNDETTTWKPMQVFWVMYKASSSMVDSYKDTYFAGDSVSKADFKHRGSESLGLRKLTSTNRRFFKIEKVKLTDDRSGMTGDIRIPSASKTVSLRVQSKYEDGKCGYETFGKINGSEEKAMKSIYVTQGFLGNVKDIELR